MSQWSALLKLTGAFQEQVLGLYSQELLPMEVRQYLAPWIESQDWKLAARDLSMANVQLQNLLEHLDNQYSRFTQEQEILQQHNFRRFKFNIQARYQADPQKLAALIRDILNHEKQILLEAQEMESQAGQPVLVSMKTGQQYEIDKRVTEVKERVQSVEQEVKFLEDLQEMFDFKYNNFQIIAKSHPGDPHLIKKRDELQVQLNELDRKRKEVLDQMKLLLGLCETLLHFLQKELDEWLLKQKLSCIGATTNTCLKLLEGWITKTVEVFLQLRRLLSLLAELPTRVSYDGDPLKTDPPNLNHRLLEMLCCLLKRSFVVDKQPIMSYPCKRPLVIKTSSQFSVRARFLVNLPKLKHSMKVSYIVDKDPPNIKGYRRFNLLGTQPKAMEDLQGEGLVVDYKHLILKEQKAGTGGKGSKGASDGLLSVVEELHLITFTTLFDCQDLKLELEVTTLPFIIISNISQFVSAWASVLWFNLLSSDPKFKSYEVEKDPPLAPSVHITLKLQSGPDGCSEGQTSDVNFFSKPPAAPWQQLAEALSWQFSCSTKRGLNADQLSMLRKKLCDKTPEEQSTVSWNKFSKENMPHGSFSFWTWFDAILSLVKGHLENIWNDGYVMGFLSRRKEDSLLKTMMTGTFLLRFSESIREGGITCSWVEHLPNGTYTIHSVQPYTKKELSNIPLTEIIRNYQLLAEENIPENPLKYLYPIIPKDEAFGQYYEHRSDVTLEYKKYLKRRLIIVSERQVQDSQNCLSPGTPQFNETEAMDMNALIDGEILEALNINNILMNPDTDPMLPYVSMESSEALQ